MQLPIPHIRPHTSTRERDAQDRDLEVAREVHRLVRYETGIALPVRLRDGTLLGPADAPFRLVLNRPSSLRSMLVPPDDLSAGEAYVSGEIDVEGDMVASLTVAAELQRRPLPIAARLRVLSALLRLPAPRTTRVRRAHLTGRPHSTTRDGAAIRFHYDVGNRFYELFLDPELQYSEAYFADPDEPLESAQASKLDLICRKLRLQPGERFLDVGCGWGSLVLHAARHYGVEALGITLSPQQCERARERIAASGLQDRAQVMIADYRELTGQFDAIASIGMFEHVGPDHLAAYFQTMYRLTHEGGRFLNSGITTGRRMGVVDMTRGGRSFIGKYVFPDGGLVPAWLAARHLEDAGFELFDLEQLRRHYALTLRHWVHRLEDNRDQAIALEGEEVYRIWRAYMAASVVGFESGDLGVVHLLGIRGTGCQRLPLRREAMTSV